MKETLSNIIAVVGGTAVMAISFGITIFYLVAFLEGMDVWFDLTGWWVAALGALLIMFLRGLGTVVVAVIGGYGAIYGWDWHWLLAVIVFFPGLAFMAGALAFTAATALFSARAS